MHPPSDPETPPATVPPDPDALLRALGAMLDEADLQAIAEADWGQDVERHLAALRSMARCGVMPSPLDWWPREVLELTRWGVRDPELDDEPQLWRCAFACCALLRAAGDPANGWRLSVEVEPLAGLVMSLHRLSVLPPPRARRRSVVEREARAAARRVAALAEVDRQAAALLAWLAPRLDDSREPHAYGVALLWFALAAGTPDAALAGLAAWTLRVGDDPGGWGGGTGTPAPWRLGEGADLRAAAWREIARLLPGRLGPEHGSAVVAVVRRVARRLAPLDYPTEAHRLHAAARPADPSGGLAAAARAWTLVAGPAEPDAPDRPEQGSEEAPVFDSVPDPPSTVRPDPDALLLALGAGMEPGHFLLAAASAAAARRSTEESGADRLGRARRRLDEDPLENLQLARWETPGDAAGHRRRAFACCALLRAFGDRDAWDDLWRQNTTLIGLIDSLDALAPPALDTEAAALLAWLIPRLPPGEMGEHAFFGLGLLWFALAIDDVPDAALVGLLDWTMEAEDAVAAPWRAELGAPLLGDWLLIRGGYDMRFAAWRAFGARLPGRLRRRHGPAVADGVRLTAAMLAGAEAPP